MGEAGKASRGGEFHVAEVNRKPRLICACPWGTVLTSMNLVTAFFQA